jgi:antitoxin component YwqK of YwqJK toxin-antitoxin module
VPYKDGKKHGCARSYYENGGLEAEMYIAQGEEGMGKVYFEDGCLSSQ